MQVKENIPLPSVLFIVTSKAERLLFHIPVKLLINPHMLIEKFTPSVTSIKWSFNPTAIPFYKQREVKLTQSV